MQAIFELDGNLFMFSDSPAIHDWDFSLAVSHYLERINEKEFEKIFSNSLKMALLPPLPTTTGLVRNLLGS